MRKQQAHCNLNRVIKNTLLRWGIFFVAKLHNSNSVFTADSDDFTCVYFKMKVRRNSLNSDFALPFKDFPGIKIYSSSSLHVLPFCCDGNAHHFKI